MKARRVVSLTAALSFITMLVSSVVLYIVPEGRVAHWANWTMLSLTKEQWADIHTLLGFLFLITLSFHIYFNWRAIMTYLKTRKKEFRLFTPELSVALVLIVVTTAGTLGGIPPFSSILHLSESIKKEASFTYGEPPFGGAQRASLESFTDRLNLDLQTGIKQLREQGVVFTSPSETLEEIASNNNTTPQQIYLTLKPKLKTSDQLQAPSSGFGKLTLDDLLTQYRGNELVIEQLQSQNSDINRGMKLKEVGELVDASPRELFEQVTGLETGE